MTKQTTPTEAPAVAVPLERQVRRAAKAALNACLFLGWWICGVLMFWLPLAFVPFDMLRHKMTFAESVRLECLIWWRTMQGDRPRA